MFLTNLAFTINHFSCCPHSFKPLSIPFSPTLVSEDPGGPLRAPLFTTPIKQTSSLSLSQDLRVGTFRRLCKCESLQCYSFSPFFYYSFWLSYSLSPSAYISTLSSGVYDYELTLRTDLYTRKHTQWFYFRVRNMKAGVTYRFTIVNLMKSSSLYSQGMRPLLYSERAAKEKGLGWQRTGSNIRYYRNYNQVGGSV